MKRLITSTTALALALATINPAALMAQTPGAACEQGGKAACESGKKAPGKKADEAPKKKKKAAEDGAGAEQKPKRQQAGDDAAPKRKKAAQEQTEEAVKPKRKPAAEEAPAGKKKAAGQQPAGKAQQERGLPATPEPEVQPPEAQPKAGEKAGKPAGGEGARDNAAPRKPGKEKAGEKAGAPDADTTDRTRKSGGKSAAQPEDQPVMPMGKAAQESGRNPALVEAEGKAAPAPKAAEALDEILAEDAPSRPRGKAAVERGGADADGTPRKPGKPKRPAAADRDSDAGDVRVTETRVGERDARRSDREPGGPLGFDKQGRPIWPKDQTASKKSGLSDLEKAGLVVLGALAVGAILKNGNRVVSNTGDRVIVDRGDGQYVVWKDDDALIRQPGSDVRTETFSDGSTRTTVYRPDGTQIVTIRDASGRVLRRARVNLDGTQTLLIDDLSDRVQVVDVDRLPKPRPGGLVVSTSQQDAALRAALLRQQAGEAGRAFSLAQIRDYPEVRALAPTVNVDSITFPTGSSVIGPSEARKLADLGRFMTEMIEANPAEMFLIEGHTDAVGDAAMNLALSDRRAESVALALTEYFGVAPENMVVQGYGEDELIIDSAGDEPRNRRAVVRMISPLMQQVTASN